MRKSKRTFKNLIALMINQIVTIIFGLLLPRLFITGYGSEVNGLLNSLNQFLVCLSLFEAGLGTISLQALLGPIAIDNWSDINSVLSAADIYYKRAGKRYFISLLLLAVIYPVIAKSSLNYISIFLMVFFSGIPNVILFVAYEKYRILLKADGRNYIIAKVSTIKHIVISCTKVILIFLNQNIVLILGIVSIINILQAFYYSSYIKKTYDKLDLRVTPKLDALNQKNYMLIHQISGMIFYNTDILILTIFCDLKIVSVYSLYKLIITYLENILNVFMNSIQYKLGQILQTNIEKYKKDIDIFDSLYSIIGFSLFTTGLYLILPFMSLYTRGVNDINYIDPVLAILFVIIAILTLIRMPMLQTINLAGHFKKTTLQTILESLINVIISIIGVQKYGIYGVLIGTIIALVYRTVDMIIYANKIILNRSIKNTVRIHLANLLVFMSVNIAFTIMDFKISSWFDFILIGCFYIVFSIIFFTCGQYIFISEYRSFIKEILLNIKK